MSALRSLQRRLSALPAPVWIAASCLLHLWLLSALRDVPEPEPGPWLALPSEIEFGLAQTPGGDGKPAAAPPPAAHAQPKQPAKSHPAHRPRRRDGWKLPTDAGVASNERGRDAAVAVADGPRDAGALAARDGQGTVEGAAGAGDGQGLGEGNGYAPAGATIALDVDLDRVRKSALLLETRALLDIIPEWQKLLAGSGLRPLEDFQRVFVATPNLQRASLVVAVQHRVSRARIIAAVAALAAERGKPAPLSQHDGFDVAAWRNRGPTERVIALTGADRFVITRRTDLARVLAVATSLAAERAQQGFDAQELREQGGLLAMQPDEAVALWVENVRRYVRGEVESVPRSLRLSVFYVDQWNSELRVHAQYDSQEQARAAQASMDALRRRLADDPRVVFFGLKSAFDAATIEQSNAALQLRVRLTLHQTRYLMRYVSRVLRPARATSQPSAAGP